MEKYPWKINGKYIKNEKVKEQKGFLEESIEEQEPETNKSPKIT